jgi:PhnB protein
MVPAPGALRGWTKPAGKRIIQNHSSAGRKLILERIIMAKVKHIPDGYHTVTPYLCVKGAAGAIDFYKKAFGAVELVRMPDPSGKVMHAEIKIGDSHIMMADEHPEMNFTSPKSLGGTPVCLCLYVEDVDALAARAVAAGATQIRPVKDQFYGDRSGTFADPFGHIWTISTHKEDVSPEEMKRRMAGECGG